MTSHAIFEADSRDLSFIDDESVHLVVTHPPRPFAREQESTRGQLSQIAEHEAFLSALKQVWSECRRVLVPGAYVCCIAETGPPAGESRPHGLLAGEIQHLGVTLGFEPLQPIRWVKARELVADETGFFGRPNLPYGSLSPDSDDIVILRKPGPSREAETLDAEMRSRLNAGEFTRLFSPVWMIPAAGAARHPDPIPLEIAERLIRMFSFAGETVLDPFAGSGTVSLAAMLADRASIGVEIEPRYVKLAERRFAFDAGEDTEFRVERGIEARAADGHAQQRVRRSAAAAPPRV